ncbi:radical SAM protein, partial [bacterium]|nr:radical SAM protein [bacterium]
VFANGCPENRIDSARIQKFFLENGWTLANEFHKADLIVFNGCGQRYLDPLKKKSLLSVDMVKKIIQKKKPSAKLIVCGCLPKIYEKPLSEIYQGTTFGPDEFEKFNEIFQSKIKIEDIYANHLIHDQTSLSKLNVLYLKKFFKLPFLTKLLMIRIWSKQRKLGHEMNVYHSNTYLIKVSTGCLFNCAFCSIHIARGSLRSKPIDKIVEEFKEGLRKGFTEFGLIGTNVGAYGRDQGTTLVALFRKLVNIEGDYKIRLQNFHPRFLIEMLPELREIFKSGKITYLESSAESGNDRILSLMNRGYKIDDYKKAIHVINKEFPEIQIRSQFIAGFPSETDDEFLD